MNEQMNENRSFFFTVEFQFINVEGKRERENHHWSNST